MGRNKLENPKVPLSVSVRKTTKETIKNDGINVGELLDNMFNKE